MNQINKNFGINVRRLRNKYKLTQEELAAKLSMSSRSIGCIETGGAFVSSEVLEKLSVFFSVEPSFFFNRVQVEHNSQDQEKIRQIVYRLNELPSEKLDDVYAVVFALTNKNRSLEETNFKIYK